MKKGIYSLEAINLFMQHTQKGFILPLIVIAAVVILGGGAWYANHRADVDSKTEMKGDVGDKKDGDSMKQEDTGMNVSANGEVTVNGSIEDIVKSGKDYECTFSKKVGTVDMAGRLYTSGENVRGEFKTNIPNYGVVTAYMIADKDNVYTWSSMVNQGFKTSKTAAVKTDTKVSTNLNPSMPSASQMADYKAQYNYTCKPWVKDAALFAVPANITFKIL